MFSSLIVTKIQRICVTGIFSFDFAIFQERFNHEVDSQLSLWLEKNLFTKQQCPEVDTRTAKNISQT